MKTTITGFITYSKDVWDAAPNISFQTWRPDPTYSSAVVVQEHSFVVETPDNFDPNTEMVKTLEERQRRAAAEFKSLDEDLQRQITQLTILQTL